MTDYSQLDESDRAILQQLQQDSSISNAELARRINLSPPAVHARVKRLEQLGFIQGYVAILDREKLGYDMLCFIQVSLSVHQPEQVTDFRRRISQMPEVLECHHVTGSIDYLLKVAVCNREDLQRFLMERLTPIPYIARIQTSLVLSEIKSTTALPLR
ncbi:MAG: Lrp/AsnC family transcriptional regulator [Chloroflexi bacterium]|nr:MAG: Lrp/AsnC family transcriptional regulator [Chloroflexota bacterium]